MLTRRLCDVLFDIADGLFRLLVPAVRHQPPRALRHETTEQQDAEAQDGSDAETKAPADIRGEQSLVQQERHSKRSCRCSEPEAAVDDEVDTTAVLRRNELVDRRIDCSVFAADAEPGDHPENREAPEIPRERTQQHAGQIDDQSDVEDQTPAMPIRDPAEDESSYDRAHDVEGSNGSKVGAGKMERIGALQGRTERADDGDFEPVKNPGDPQSDDDQKVKPAPGKPIEAKWDVGPDHGLRIRRLHR